MEMNNRMCRTAGRMRAGLAVLACAMFSLLSGPLRGQDAEAVYVVGEQDVLSIAVWGQETLSVSVPVRPDGRISMPLVGEIVAAGRSPEQIRQSIEEILSQYFTTRQTVSVIVTEIHSKKVYILGQVLQPGVFDMRRSLSLLQALAMAGGLTEFANRDGILVIRRRPDGSEQRIGFNYKKAVSGKDSGEDLFLESGDIVVVP
jgi:polysaccharide export outer membrane protein